MGAIVVFGAGGRAGRAVVEEARRRGHRVTAVVRDPARHPDMDTEGVTVVAGDVTDAASVTRLADGHDAAVGAVYDPTVPAGEFYPAAARALLDAGTPRLVIVGLASVLPTAAGPLLMDTPGYPNAYRDLYLGHAAGVEALRTGEGDWLVLSPSGDFDHAGGRTGRYRLAPADAADRISYADLAVAVLDEIDTPKHVGVTTA
jgi:putative NADH-flavin reductase